MKSHIIAAAVALAAGALLGAGQARALDEGVTADTIYLGTTIPLTGPAGPSCKPISDAASAWFKHVNDNGGIHKRKIESIVMDDAYKAPEALANGRELAAKPVFAIFGGCGTVQPPALLPITQKAGMPYLFPFAGNPELFRACCTIAYRNIVFALRV